MTYDGHVKSSGPSEKRALNLLTIWKTSVSRMNNNTYLLVCERTGATLLIDAADEADRLLELVTRCSGRLDVVVTTHQHWDHHRALLEVLGATGATSICGADDAVGLPAPRTAPSTTVTRSGSATWSSTSSTCGATPRAR